MTDERNTFIENGWQQFCIIQPNSHTSLLEYAHTNIEDNDLLLVVTQTCDLVNEVDKEPFFEVLPLHPLNQNPSPEYQYAKNSRRIELVLNINDHEQNFYALPFQRFFVRHKILKDISPFATIQDEEPKTHLIKWITNRYNRAAFPDTFDQRWKVRKKQIEKTIKKLQLINDIYIKLSPFTELASDDDKYDLDIILLMDAHSYDDPTIYQNYNQVRQTLENQFSQCAGININSVDLESNASITVKELQEYARWDYSYLSFRDPENHAQPQT